MNDKFIKWLDNEIEDLNFQGQTGDMFPLGKHSEAIRIRAMYRQMMMDDKSLKNNPRYKDFIFLPEPIPFNEYFKDKSYHIVQIHDLTPVGSDDIVGFAGVCRWHNGNLMSIDGDSYTKSMKVYGFKEFRNKDNEICLDVLSYDW